MARGAPNPDTQTTARRASHRQLATARPAHAATVPPIHQMRAAAHGMALQATSVATPSPAMMPSDRSPGHLTASHLPRHVTDSEGHWDARAFSLRVLATPCDAPGGRRLREIGR